MTATTTHASNGIARPLVSRLIKAKDLHLEHEFWHNPRTITGLDASEIKSLADDIQRRGVKDPLTIVMVYGEGDKEIPLVIDGQRRTLAVLSFDPNMYVPVVEYTPPGCTHGKTVELTWEISDRILLDMLAVGNKRKGLSDFEMSEVAERMKNRGDGKTLDAIGDAIDRSASWVSRILSARASATPDLLKRWRKGDLTTEQFKDLAAVKDPVKQTETIQKVVEARKSGDAAEARTLAKEAALEAKPKTDPVKPKVEPVVKGPQKDLFADPKVDAGQALREPTKAEPPKVKKPSPVVLEDLLRLADKKPPTSERVQGIIAGVKYAMGLVEPDQFGKAWNEWITRASGAPRPVKAKAKPAKKAAKARKPAPKKAAKKSRR